jgi:hypothetical protein
MHVLDPFLKCCPNAPRMRTCIMYVGLLIHKKDLEMDVHFILERDNNFHTGVDQEVSINTVCVFILLI